MSWNVYLEDESGQSVTVPQFCEGGTYVLGGSTAAELNITYNYSPLYYQHLNGDQGLNWLNGQRAGDTVNALQSAVQALGTIRDDDYWKATAGNAGAALALLLSWGRQYPDATWRVH